MIQRYRTLGAMIALDTFTIRALAIVSGVGTPTVQTVVARERKRHRVEEVGRLQGEGRGNRAKIYRLVPSERRNMENELRELEQARRLVSEATASPETDGDKHAVPGALLAAEHVLLHQLPNETDPRRRQHLMRLAELSIIDGTDGGAVPLAWSAGTAAAQAHAAAARFLLHLAEVERVAEQHRVDQRTLDDLEQAFESVAAQLAGEGEKTLEKALKERFRVSLVRLNAPLDSPMTRVPRNAIEELKAVDIMRPGDVRLPAFSSVVVAALAMRDLGVGALPVCNEAGALVGMITDRDIVVHAVAEGRNLADTTVGDIAQQTASITMDTDVSDVLDLMETHQISRLPVLDEAGQLVGMITEHDVATKLSMGDEFVEASTSDPTQSSQVRDEVLTGL